jgi:hypothetical protein
MAVILALMITNTNRKLKAEAIRRAQK